MVVSQQIAEAILFSGGLLINVFVIPTLLDKSAAIPRIQSIAFVVSLGSISFAYYSLELFFPMLSVIIGTVLWSLVAIYRPTDSAYLGLENMFD